MFSMHLFTLIGLTDCVFFLVSSHPIDKSNPELIAGYFEGDMILSTEQQRIAEAPNTTRKARHALFNANYRWPNCTVPYQLSADFSKRELNLILEAMEHISANTCIRFVPNALTARSSLLSFVMVRPSEKGCSSEVGYRHHGVQYINLRPMRRRSIGCFRLGTIVHELLHTLGIFHQQSASDRDQYVRIYEENIESGKEHNFRKLPKGFVSSFGVNYDYASVMHYERYAFSWNGLPTIEPLHGEGDVIGQREGLSEKDILKIRRMYKC